MESSSLYRNPALIACGRFVFRYRNFLFPSVVAALCAFVVFRTPDDLFGWDADYFDTLGLIVAVVGETLRALTVGFDYIKRGGVNKRIHARNLVTTGMFGRCRNPLYAGNVLLILGILLVGMRFDLLILAAVACMLLVVAVAYVSLVAAEEEYLLRTFGTEYEAYCRSVSRWVPDVRGIVRTWRRGAFNGRRVLLKEYTSVYSWCVGAFSFEMAEELGAADVFQVGEMWIDEALFAVASVTFVTILILKKTAILRERSA